MADPYSALARRYRPQTFDEVIGQEHISRALRNAIRNDRVAHGYIFTGARGVGKTSTARIFAKALNCLNAVDGVPCNQCDVCEAISAGNDVDVIEMDGASNRGIDEIRQLRANATVRPMRAKNKIYIIDEAHQLTKDAWNALLKTLEEPPANVKFIFCTTEPEKLLDTVKSRCQRFDFSTVETTSIVDRLQQIAEAEGFSVESEALELVARRAGGSMRDSQSLFDQLLAFGTDPITPADVHQLLGTADEQRLLAIAAGLADGEPKIALSELDQTLGSGVRIQELFDQLIEYFRDLMVLASGAGDVPLLSISESQREILAGQAKQFGLNTVLAATQILAEAASRMKTSSVARPVGELALARIALLNDLDDLADLIAAVRSGKGGVPAATTPGRRGSRAEVPAQKKTKDNGEAASAAPIATPAPFPFEAGRERELMTQIQEKAGDALRAPLMGASRVAITGPDALELGFPTRYSSSHEHFSSPAGKEPLEQLLAEIVGRPIRVISKCVEEPSQTPESKIASEKPAAARDRPARAMGSRRNEAARVVNEETVGDPFVKLVMTVFETSEARVKTLPSRSNE